MRRKRKDGRVSEQYVAFLIRQDINKVHIDVTASKEPAAVLRRAVS